MFSMLKKLLVTLVRLKNFAIKCLDDLQKKSPDYILKLGKWVRKIYRRRRKKWQTVADNNKLFFYWFYKRIFVVGFLVKIRATPRNLLRYLKRAIIIIASFFRSSIVILISQNWEHPYIKIYFVINCIIFLLIKWWQEVRFNFECPLATLLYGKFVKKERNHKKKSKDRKQKSKLHKFVKDPFKNKIERQKAIDRKQKIIDDKKALKQVEVDAYRIKMGRLKLKYKKELKVWRKKMKKKKMR